MLAPVVVVALPARRDELAFAVVERGATLSDNRVEPRTGGGSARLAARLQAHIGGERQHLLALIGERLSLLVLLTGHIDPLLQVDRPTRCGVKRRIACGDALHAG